MNDLLREWGCFMFAMGCLTLISVADSIAYAIRGKGRKPTTPLEQRRAERDEDP